MKKHTTRCGWKDIVQPLMAGSLSMVILFLGAGCILEKKKDPPVKTEKPVQVTMVRRGIMEKVLSYTGTIEPIEKAEIYSKIPGKVERVYLREGDRVKAGEIVIQIEDDDLQAALAQAEAALKMAHARVSQAKSGVGFQAIQTYTQIQQAKNALIQAEAHNKLDRKDLQRMENLFARGAIARQQLDVIETKEEVSRKALDSARENLNLARATVAQNRIHEEDVRVAQASVSQAEASLLVAKTQLKYARIASPVSGVVTFRGVEPGELVAASTMGRQTPLLRVVNNSAVNVEAQVPEKDVNLFSDGKAVEVVIDAVMPGKYRGKVNAIVPAADQQSRSFKVKVSLSNTGGRLKSGMFARIESVSYRNPMALLIPREAIQDHRGKKMVFVVEQNIARMRDVKIGINDEANSEIQSGLKEGETVVTAGQAALNDGDQVKVERGVEH